MSDIDNDINMALWRAAMCGDSEAVSHALDGKKLLRCVDDRQYKNKNVNRLPNSCAGVDGFQYEVDDLPVTMYGELDYSENYVYPIVMVKPRWLLRKIKRLVISISLHSLFIF